MFYILMFVVILGRCTHCYWMNADESQCLHTIIIMPLSICHHNTFFITTIWLSIKPVHIEPRFTCRPVLFITTRLLQPDPDTSIIQTLLQLVHVIHVVSGGQICVFLSAVSLSFSPVLRLIYKVILTLNTFRYGAESCERDALL